MNRLERWIFKSETLSRYTDKEIKNLSFQSKLIVMFSVLWLVVAGKGVYYAISSAIETDMTVLTVVFILIVLMLCRELAKIECLNIKIQMMDRELRSKS